MISLILGLLIFHFILYEDCKYDDFQDSFSYALYDRLKQICRGEL